MTVLVVDDDDKVLDLFQRFFKIRSITGQFAISSDDAIEIYGNNKDSIKSLVIDLTIDGNYTSVDVIRKVKEDHPDLTVFVITGGLFDSYRDDLVKFSNIEMIQKPFSFNELLTSIEKVI